jgi:ATPase subunit of ABC transporter with duplicated ATPase domains
MPRRIHFSFPPTPRSGKEVITLSHISKTNGANTVYGDLGFTLYAGDRAGATTPPTPVTTLGGRCSGNGGNPSTA